MASNGTRRVGQSATRHKHSCQKPNKTHESNDDQRQVAPVAGRRLVVSALEVRPGGGDSRRPRHLCTVSPPVRPEEPNRELEIPTWNTNKLLLKTTASEALAVQATPLARFCWPSERGFSGEIANDALLHWRRAPVRRGCNLLAWSLLLLSASTVAVVSALLLKGDQQQKTSWR